MAFNAVATAAFAAVFFIMRNSQQGSRAVGDMDLFNSAMAFLSVGLYLAAAALAGVGIFGGNHLSGDQRAAWKRTRTHEVFWTILVGIAFTAFTTFTLPTMQSWHQQQEPPSTPTAGSENPTSSLNDNARQAKTPAEGAGRISNRDEESRQGKENGRAGKSMPEEPRNPTPIPVTAVP